MYKSATAFYRNNSSKLIFAGGRTILTKALASTRSGHCTSGIKSSEEVTKSFLFFFSNKLADQLDLELLEL